MEDVEIYNELRKVKHQLANTTQQISGINKMYEHIQEENTELRTRLDRILLVLEGDQLAKTKGLVDRLIAVEDFIVWFKQKKAVVTGYVLGISFVMGVAASLYWSLVKLVGFLKSFH
jgi:regulator of replication initiation timing